MDSKTRQHCRKACMVVLAPEGMVSEIQWQMRALKAPAERTAVNTSRGSVVEM